MQWAPDGQHFAVVAGFMPAKPVLYTSKCRALFEFTAGPFNTVRWNPFGRFLALAGFGNLPGDVAFFNKMKDGKCKHMGSTRCGHCVSTSENAVYGHKKTLCMDIRKRCVWTSNNSVYGQHTAHQHANRNSADNGVTIEWAPDGRSVLVGTTTPRLRVDNCMRAFKYDGTLLGKVAYDVLLDVRFVPAEEGVFEDRPQSPGTQKPQVRVLTVLAM